jgi:hypothetical protein
MGILGLRATPGQKKDIAQRFLKASQGWLNTLNNFHIPDDKLPL